MEGAFGIGCSSVTSVLPSIGSRAGAAVWFRPNHSFYATQSEIRNELVGSPYSDHSRSALNAFARRLDILPWSKS